MTINEIDLKCGCESGNSCYCSPDVSESVELACSILPLDHRRLLSVASDICDRHASPLGSYDKARMTWAIIEFHKFLVKKK